jgi:hypothetical protein
MLTYQQIAGDASRQTHHRGEGDHPEEVEAGAHAGQSAAEAEDERAGQAEAEDQVLVELLTGHRLSDRTWQ